jgi:hypothetical protein
VQPVTNPDGSIAGGMKPDGTDDGADGQAGHSQL